MDEVEEHSHLWDGSDPDWVLFRLGPESDGDDAAGFIIINRRTSLGLIVEDDGLKQEIVSRMLRAGVPVITEPP
jgi:hypothetical protein